jgi:putative tryptophan/tyrosine transport system substrate-binding protein
MALMSCSAASPAAAQQAPKRARIGVVSAGAARSAPHWVAFDTRLQELARAEGRTIAIEFRNLEGRPEHLPRIMAELVRMNVDAIVAPGPESTLRAAQQATTTIPIVTVAIDYDPVARGLVSGLQGSGTNVTGVFLQQVELTGKRLGLLKELSPGIRRAAVFWDAFAKDQLEEAERAAQSLRLELQRHEFSDPPYEFTVPVKAAVRERAGAVLCLASPVLFRQRDQLAAALIGNRLPAVSPFREMTEAGILTSYGANLPHMFRRAAEYVERILGGSKPADLPMEQPTKFELVINLKTAKALGLTIPPSVLLRADQVVE